MFDRFTSGSASRTIEQATGENDGFSLPVIGGAAVAAYVIVKQVM